MPKGIYDRSHLISDPKKRFWSKVRKTKSCWFWRGKWNVTGYGMFQLVGRRVLAHRLAYEYTYGPIPKGKLILHSCDKPRCVYPEHLRVGDHRQNLLEAYARGLHKMSAGGKYAKSNKAVCR